MYPPGKIIKTWLHGSMVPSLSFWNFPWGSFLIEVFIIIIFKNLEHLLQLCLHGLQDSEQEKTDASVNFMPFLAKMLHLKSGLDFLKTLSTRQQLSNVGNITWPSRVLVSGLAMRSCVKMIIIRIIVNDYHCGIR
jgi:hypothetical protein